MDNCLVRVKRWARVDPFLPTSPHHVKAYLKHKHYLIPKHRTTKKETTNEESLEALIRQHPNDPLLPAVLESRHLVKAMGYLDDSILGRDGRLHPSYTFIPKTGRLSSKRPNMMNIPQGRKGDVMKMVARAIRSTIIPTPGYVLGEFDWKAIEALLVGYFADDPDYMEASRKGVHDIFGSHLLTRKGIIPNPKTPYDSDLVKWIEWFKKEHEGTRAIAKKRIHAGAYGQGAYNMARDLGVSVAEVRELDEVFAAMAPKVARWQRETRLRAHKEGRLMNPFGYMMTFFFIFNIDGTLGKEATECLAFLPQSTAAGMLRDVLVDLGNHPEEGSTFRLLVPTHDSITFEMREDRVDYVMGLVKAKMEKKWDELGGLSVETEGKMGPTLTDLTLWQPKVVQAL